MIKKKIKFTGADVIEDVKKIVEIATTSKYDVDVVSGRYVVDAKSIMGWFSLNLNQPLEIGIHCDNEADCADVLAGLKEFLA